MVASDVDGTLLRSDRTVSDRTREVLDAVVRTGSAFVYVTGRPRRWLPPVVEQTGHAGLAVVANGALVVDLDTDRVVHARPMGDDLAREVVARVRATLAGVVVGVEWADGFAHEEGFRGRSGTDGTGHDPDVVDDEGLVSRPVLKLLARYPDGSSVGAAVAEALDGVAQVTWSTNDGLAEVSAPGVHKATTLAWLAERLDTSAEDTLAFGDMPNDLQLLRWASHGVAVANAHPDVLATADEVTSSNDEDGVAIVLERHFGDGTSTLP